MSNKPRFIIDKAINQLTTRLPLKNVVFNDFEYFHNIILSIEKLMKK